MKYFATLFILCTVCFAARAQFTYKIKADSVKITNDSCSAELILENSTKNIKGFLYNKGNGRTEFRKGLVMSHDTLFCGSDTFHIGGTFWKLSGNSGTNSSNFVGTTDNVSLNFRTHNIQRLSIRESIVAGSVNIGAVEAGQLSSFATKPGQINIWGKDISGYSIPLFLAGNVAGMTWSASGGANNTVGRFIRMSQWTDSAGPNYNFFDLGIDQQSDFYITEQNTWAGGGGVLPKKMITITPTDYLGINFAWGQHPTANFHTRGTVRLEDLTNNDSPTKVVVADANNNLYTRTVSSIAGNQWSITGNAGNSSSNFLGTTDNVPLIFKTNNVERMRIRGTGSGVDGFVGIGTSQPTSLLHLYGTNPSLQLEGDSNSYYPSVVFKSRAFPVIGVIDPYGIYSNFIGGAHVWSTTGIPLGRVEISATTAGIRSLSIDSTIITHQVIGARNQIADIFDVASNISGINGNSIPGSLFTVKNTGKLVFSKYLNNVTEDSVLSTDASGVVKLRSLGSSITSNAWSLTGNAGTNPSSNFLGTTDSKRLVFRTNNIERATIDSLGRVGIGTSTPTDLLTVVKSETGLTADSKIINANAQGATFNTTSSALTSYGGYFNSNATRTSGSNNLTNIGLFATASGAQVNYALKTDGSVNMTNLPTSTDTTSYKPLGINSSGDVVKVTGWPPAVNYTVQSLTDGSTITWNAANGINAVVTLGGTGRTLSITNPMAGMTYTIRIIQDGTGSRTITTWPTNSKWPSGTTPTLSTVANRYDIVVLYYDGTNYYGTYQQNFQ